MTVTVMLLVCVRACCRSADEDSQRGVVDQVLQVHATAVLSQVLEAAVAHCRGRTAQHGFSHTHLILTSCHMSRVPVLHVSNTELRV